MKAKLTKLTSATQGCGRSIGKMICSKESTIHALNKTSFFNFLFFFNRSFPHSHFGASYESRVACLASTTSLDFSDNLFNSSGK